MALLRQRARLTVAIAVAVTAVVAGLWATNGFGKERSRCPHGAGATAVQPKEGPGRPPMCPASNP